MSLGFSALARLHLLRTITVSRSNWDTALLRIGFSGLCVGISIYLQPFGSGKISASFFGVLFALLCNALEMRVRRARLTAILGASLGLVIGGLIGSLFGSLYHPAPDDSTAQFFKLLLPLTAGFVGLMVGISKSDFINIGALRLFANSKDRLGTIKFLDTSVLIDGRIAEIAETGFLDGTWIIPQFVLNELQMVADSSDTAKRNRGRRGLDVVQRLQSAPGIAVEISPVDFPDVREVDWKLIEAAKAGRGKIVTTDFNLNKLARVQGIEVLNINQLANALRPAVLAGETMRVFIAKEGKEQTQGIAYLDDGTMVVVDNARRQISKTVDITVTSVLQTTAGKMIFGKYDGRSRDSGESRVAVAGS